MVNPTFRWRTALVLGIGFCSHYIIWRIYNVLVPPLLADLGLSALAVGFVMAWDNIIDVLSQPWIGARSDHVPGRLGRRKPWLMVGAPLAAVFFVLIPYVRSNLVLLLGVLLGVGGATALFRTPLISYLGDLFEARDRSRANGVITLIAGLGASVALFAGGALYRIAVPLPFIFGGAAMLIAVLVVLLVVREPDYATTPRRVQPAILVQSLRPRSARVTAAVWLLLAAIFCWYISFSAIEAFFTLYARSALGIDQATAGQMLVAWALMLVIFALPAGLVAGRLGRKRVILIGLVGMVTCSILAFSLHSASLLLIILGLFGICWSLTDINSLPLIYDCGAGQNVGALTGLTQLAWAAGAIAGPVLGGAFIQLAGNNYAVLWPFTGVFFGVAALLTISVRPQPGMEAGPLDAQVSAGV